MLSPPRAQAEKKSFFGVRAQEGADAEHRLSRDAQGLHDGKGVHGEFARAVVVFHLDAEGAEFFHEVEGEDGEGVVLRRDGECGREVLCDVVDGGDLVFLLCGQLVEGFPFSRSKTPQLSTSPAIFW